MLTTIFTSVIGALCVAGLLAAVKSRWLYVIAPKLYLNTPISDGQIISINIFNAGLTSEEDVAVTFRQACKFELIGTSKSTLSVNGKTLSIPKLSRLESITVVLLIEGKAFDPADIESVESKSTNGKGYRYMANIYRNSVIATHTGSAVRYRHRCRCKK